MYKEIIGFGLALGVVGVLIFKPVLRFEYRHRTQQDGNNRDNRYTLNFKILLPREAKSHEESQEEYCEVSSESHEECE